MIGAARSASLLEGFFEGDQDLQKWATSRLKRIFSFDNLFLLP